MAATDEDTKYSLGSVLNHVLLHQTVIGQEAIKQMAMAGDEPDVVIGCAGGGSNFSGHRLPVPARQAGGRPTTRFLAVEPASCPSLTRGEYRYDFGDAVGMTPLVKMHTLGNELPAGPDPRRRAALPRHGADGLAPLRAGLHRGQGLRPEHLLRGGGPVRTDRGDHPGARVDATPSGRRSTRRSRPARRASRA